MGYIGLLTLNFMSMFLIACMGVVGYAMAGEFDAVSQVGLVFALEACCRCTVCPISGKLGEKLGRKQLLIGALIVCTAAYAVAAFATNFTVILVTRCLAGAAWACWMVNSFLLFCDLFGQSEGPKYSGIAQTVGTVSILIAAPVAGLICKYDWRITFYVSVPVLVLITVLCAAGLPRSQKSAGGGRMDVAGSLFCALMLVPFCLAMSLGSLKGWTSPLMLVFYALTAVGLVGLVAAEKRADDPILPVRLLKNRYYLAIFVTSFCFCVATTAGQYVPTYLMEACGVSSTLSGLVSTPGSVVCAILTVFLGGYAAKHGRYRGMTVWWCLLSLASGVLMLFVGTPATDGFAFLFCMAAIFPMGVGQAMQQIVPYTYPMKVLEPKDLAAGSAFMTFSGIFSGAVSSGIFSALMNSSGGMVTMFRFPIAMFVVMAIFGIFLFRDIKSGETL